MKCPKPFLCGLALATLSLTSTALPSRAAPPVTEGLKSWYTFASGVDESGKGNNFTIVNPAGSVTYNSADSYASFGEVGGIQAANTGVNSMTGTAFTISLWYHNNGATNDTSLSFGRKWVSTSGATNKSFMFNYAAGNYEIFLQSSGTTSKLVKFAMDIPQQNEWTYISLVYDGGDNGMLKLYISESGGEEFIAPTAFEASGVTALGNDSTATYLISRLDGDLSGYAIYNRALDTAEINQLYLSGRRFEAIPEGSTTALLGVGLGLLGTLRLRKVWQAPITR